MEAVGSYTSFIWRVLLSLILILVSHVLTAWSRDWDKPGHDHRGRQAPGKDRSACSVTAADTLIMRFTRPMHRQSWLPAPEEHSASGHAQQGSSLGRGTAKGWTHALSRSRKPINDLESSQTPGLAVSFSATPAT